MISRPQLVMTVRKPGIGAKYSDTHGPNYKKEKTGRRSLQFTRRQLEVLRLRLQGLTRKQVAEQLGVSKSSIVVVERELFNKLGVDTVAEVKELLGRP